MSKESKLKELFSPTIVLVMICLIASLFLAVTYRVTAPRIAEISKQRADSARIEVLPAADAFDDVTADYELEDGVTEIYKAKNETGYVITSQSKGFGGMVTVMTALDNSGKILKVKVTAANDETPGLGSKATLPSHTDQFTGATAISNDPEEGGDATVINAVTGASYTSRAVYRSVSAALVQFEKIGGQENE